MFAEGNGYQVDIRAVEDVTRQLASYAEEYGALIKEFKDLQIDAGLPPVGQPVAAAAAHVQRLLEEAQAALLALLDQTNQSVRQAMAGYAATDGAGTQNVTAVVAGSAPAGSPARPATAADQNELGASTGHGSAVQ